jgi:raffinose/stachyose/melibiose transport system substrate-binding protein
MRNTLRSRTLAAAVVVALVFGVGFATSASSATKKVSKSNLKGTLTVLTKFADPLYAPYFQSVANAFQKANPGLKLNFQQVADQPYKDKIRVLATAGKLPDVYFSWAGDFAGKFVRAGMAADLTKDLKSAWGKSLAPAAVNAFQYSGKSFGVPIDLDAKVFVYNKKLFAQAGVTVPTSFDGLLATCDKLKAANIQPIAFGNQFGWPAIHYLTQLNAQNVPAKTLVADYDPKIGNFRDPGYVKALQEFLQINSHCLTPNANAIAHHGARADLTSGKAAMQYVEVVEFGAYSAQAAGADFASNWDFFPMPPIAGAKGDNHALTGAPDGFLVNSKTKNRAAAIAFLQFLTSKANAQQMTKQLGWLSPVAGSTTPSNSDAHLQKALATIQHASSMAIWLDTVTHAEVANAYLSGAQALLDGTKTPEQVMSDVQAAADRAKALVG